MKTAEAQPADAEPLGDDEPFDAAWYLEAYPDVRDSGFDPLEHYLAHGRAEARLPNPLFGARDRRTASPRVPAWFDPVWYLEANADLRAVGANPVDHYLGFGHAEARPPNRTLATLKSVRFRPPLRQDYRERAVLVRVLVDSGVFDPDWYRARYGASAAEAPMHYAAVGAFLGHDPNPVFSSLGYLEANPDLAALGINPLVHYIQHGMREGRRGGVRAGADFRLTARVWREGR